MSLSTDRPVVPYQVYLKYVYYVSRLPERQAMMRPSVFLQRYARYYNKKTGRHEPLKLEPWQSFAVDDPSDNAIWVKPRQVGFSFLRAARGLANALMRPNYTAVFVSYNRDEAKNKIIYARDLFESMDYLGKPELKTDNTGELRWNNGSRIISLPAKAVRGYSDPDVFGDEWAFVARADSIYSGTQSSGSRGGGTFTVGSTPYGEGNHFFSIWCNELNQYREFARHRIEWWYSLAMCTNVPRALKMAPEMTTKDRVEAFGTDKMRKIFASLALEDFQREHECSFAARDDTVIPRMKLMQCSLWQEDTPPPGHESTPDLDRERCVVDRFKDLDENGVVEKLLPAVRRALSYMHKRSVFRLGYDVGRNHDASQLVIFEQDQNGALTMRACIALFNTELDVQEGFLKALCADSRMLVAHIDATGLGTQLAESTRKFFVPKNTPDNEGAVRCINFANAGDRFEVFSSIVQAVESQGILIEPFDDLFIHFSSFKRAPVPGQFGDNYVLIKGRNRDGMPHHCEIVVAMGLALFGYGTWKPKKAIKPADAADDEELRWVPGRRGYLTSGLIEVPEGDRYTPSGVYLPSMHEMGMFNWH